VEDLLIAGWVAIANPLLFRAGGDKGIFDSGQPLEGLLRLAAVLGVLVCLAARRKDDDGATPPRSLMNSGAVGPLTGGLLLVTISGFIALGAPTPVVYVVLLVAAVGMIAIRLAAPPLSLFVKRALVTPFVMVAGGLYWTVIESVVGTPGVAAVRRTALADPHQAELALLFLLAFSAVYYAMLVYAPRQIAEKEGGRVVWVLRYAAFVVSIALGIGWLSILSS
jgi:hypothetical protein